MRLVTRYLTYLTFFWRIWYRFGYQTLPIYISRAWWHVLFVLRGRRPTTVFLSHRRSGRQPYRRCTTVRIFALYVTHDSWLTKTFNNIFTLFRFENRIEWIILHEIKCRYYLYSRQNTQSYDKANVTLCSRSRFIVLYDRVHLPIWNLGMKSSACQVVNTRNNQKVRKRQKLDTPL